MARRELIAVHAITLMLAGVATTIPPGAPVPPEADVDDAEQDRLVGLGAAREAAPGTAAAAPATKRARKAASQASAPDASTDGQAAGEGAAADSEGGEAA